MLMELLFKFSAILLSTSIWFYLLRRKDLFSPEPLLFLIKIMLLGGFLSLLPAGIINSFVIQNIENYGSNSILENLLIGLNEESWKLLLTILLLKNHPYFDEPVDGIIYAATVALGFSSLENMDYINRYGLNALLPRHFISVPAHLSFAMLWGYGLSVAKFKYPNRSLLTVIWPYFLAAVFFHSLFNFTVGITPNRINIIIVLLLVIILYRYGLHQINSLLRYSPLRLAGLCPSCKTINNENNQHCFQCNKELS